MNYIYLYLYIASSLFHIYLTSQFLSFGYTFPLIIYLIYKMLSIYDYCFNIPHIDIFIILYSILISFYNPYLFICYSISLILLFFHTSQDIELF